MKIQSRENINGNIKSIVLIGSKTFIRIQKNFVGPLGIQVVEWRNKKTNSLVNADKHKLLEDKFNIVDITTVQPVKTTKKYGYDKLPASGSTSFHSFDVKKYDKKTEREIMIDNRIVEYCESGTMLMAVKYYKEMTAIGLKEAKQYVDELWTKVKKRKDAESTFVKPDKDDRMLKKMNEFFPNNASRKMFILETKKMSRDFGVLATIKHMREKTNWGLYEAKMFYDNIIAK